MKIKSILIISVVVFFNTLSVSLLQSAAPSRWQEVVSLLTPVDFVAIVCVFLLLLHNVVNTLHSKRNNSKAGPAYGFPFSDPELEKQFKRFRESRLGDEHGWVDHQEDHVKTFLEKYGKRD